MSVYWGTQDPVALEPMADRIKLWRPVTDLHKMRDCGHWPSIEVRHDARVDSVSLSPDGTRVASGARDQTVRIWNADTGALLHTLDGHDGRVRSVVFSPDGARLASADGEGVVRIWDPATGAPVTTFDKEQGQYYFVTYNDDGSRLAGPVVQRRPVPSGGPRRRRFRGERGRESARQGPSDDQERSADPHPTSSRFAKPESGPPDSLPWPRCG